MKINISAQANLHLTAMLNHIHKLNYFPIVFFMIIALMFILSVCDVVYAEPNLAAPETQEKIVEIKEEWHPPHIVRVWTTSYKNRIFRITQLPRCNHVEAVISYNTTPETVKQAKKRFNGIAAATGSFHHPRSFALADFMQKNGSILSSARTGRPMFLMCEDGHIEITRDYDSVKGKSGMSAVALGQRLVPLNRDGFSVAFMNQVTDRMAIGLNSNFIYIVQGKSDIWRLSKFMSEKLPCSSAINCDGGHVVRGKSPVHIVFRWKK